MNKVIVETKSRSKHVFEVEDSDVAYFNPNNITSVKIEKVG